MIYTSYFANQKNLPSNCIPVSISRFPPKWYYGTTFSRLAPSEQLLSDYHAGLSEEEYDRRYRIEVLEKEPIAYLLRDLFGALDIEEKLELRSVPGKWWENPNIHVVLLCYEKPEDFCHRHLVAEWMRSFGIPVEEWSKQKSLSTKKSTMDHGTYLHHVQKSIAENIDIER